VRRRQKAALKPMRAWCVCELNGKPVLWSGHLPGFWLRRVANIEAHERGWKDGEFTVRRIVLTDAAS
jgi:hypothetical protein